MLTSINAPASKGTSHITLRRYYINLKSETITHKKEGNIFSKTSSAEAKLIYTKDYNFNDVIGNEIKLYLSLMKKYFYNSIK